MNKLQADKWIRFIRSYGPIARLGNMFAENSAELAKAYDIPELRFEHPMEKILLEAIEPASGRITNIILTGTAGGGKSWLCYRMWERLGGSMDDLRSKPLHKALEVHTPTGTKVVNFLFDLSGLAPEKGQPWPKERVAMIERLAASIRGQSDEFFVVACNDGKLLQVWRGLAETHPQTVAAKLRCSIDELLAGKQTALPDLRLLFLNLSTTKSADLLRRATDALVSRDEWKCFDDLSDDSAYGEQSPLRKNWLILRDSLFYSRLEALMELCDASGFHVPIRDVLMLLVNALLGHPKVGQHVMNAKDIRNVVANGTGSLAAIHRNLFGDNLPSYKKTDRRVFGYLALFRVGLETSNEIDNLLLFGQEIPELRPLYEKLIASGDIYGPNPTFERLRNEYLSAEDFTEDKRELFMDELANERRRLFFRIPEGGQDSLKVWDLTIFQSADRYRRDVLGSLAMGQPVPANVVEDVVRGLNRTWSGMLIDDGTHLHLTSALDFTTARVSPVALHAVPVVANYYNEQISIRKGHDGRPLLVIGLLDVEVFYVLDLLRFEFLYRVAHGSLPNSFSRECYEDVIDFKSRTLAAWEAKQPPKATRLRIMTLDDHGTPREHSITL